MENKFNDIIQRIDTIEKKVDKILEIVNKPKKNTTKSKNTEFHIEIDSIYAAYKKQINKRSRLIDKAKKKIAARLNEYELEELLMAIEKFSQDSWWMENNSHRGIAWFFHSEERIEQFQNLVPQQKKHKYELLHNNQQCKKINNSLMIYTPWAGSWLNWNKNHPEYEKFVLKEDGNVIEKGKKAYQLYLDKQTT